MLIKTVVKYKPKTVGKNPVIATPSPNKASANTAKICSLITRRTKTMVKAKNPGTSLRLCRIPISIPVNAAFSTTTYDPLSLNIAIRLIVIMQPSSSSSNKLTFTSTNS